MNTVVKIIVNVVVAETRESVAISAADPIKPILETICIVVRGEIKCK